VLIGLALVLPGFIINMFPKTLPAGKIRENMAGYLSDRSSFGRAKSIGDKLKDAILATVPEDDEDKRQSVKVNHRGSFFPVPAIDAAEKEAQTYHRKL
jgi:hypothetical protein